MKRFPQLCLFLFFSLSAFALEEGHARYVGGTVPGLTSGVIGRLDTTSTTSLTFARAGNKVEIPYTSIESYEYSKDVTRHRGGLPAIAVGLVKMRRHSHYFSISYRTEARGACTDRGPRGAQGHASQSPSHPADPGSSGRLQSQKCSGAAPVDSRHR
jgi:hypothetical protein